MRRATVIALLLIAGAVCAHAQGTFIADPDIRSYVLENYDADGNGWISSSEALTVDSIWVDGGSVIDLGGLQDFVNLSNISIINAWDADLTGWGVTDLTPIAGLTELFNLDLVNVPVGEVSSLGNLVKVEYFNIGRYIPTDGLVTDITPLANLANLRGPTLDGHEISDICPTNGLGQLEALEFNGNLVSDISCLTDLPQLNELEFGGNPINDISVVEWMTNLDSLVAGGCLIDDISPLVGNSDIDTGDSLYIDGNLLDESDCADIGNLAGRGLGEFIFNPQQIGHICEGGILPQNEREALVELYNSTNGDNWHDNSGWLGPEGTENTWFGVRVEGGHVKSCISRQTTSLARFPTRSEI